MTNKNEFLPLFSQRHILTHQTNHITGYVLMINYLSSTQQAPTVFRSYIPITSEIKGA